MGAEALEWPSLPCSIDPRTLQGESAPTCFPPRKCTPLYGSSKAALIHDVRLSTGHDTVFGFLDLQIMSTKKEIDSNILWKSKTYPSKMITIKFLVPGGVSNQCLNFGDVNVQCFVLPFDIPVKISANIPPMSIM